MPSSARSVEELRALLASLAERGEDDDEPVYIISVAAELVGVHAQTLRHYERVGLIEPARSEGNIRLFSPRDVKQMRAITILTGDLGVNLAGVEAILDLHHQIEDLQAQVADLQADLRVIRGYLLEDQDRPRPRPRRRRVGRRG